jgi:hypothetical protein
MQRICKLCNQEKPLEEFRRNKRNQLGRDWQCKKCRYEIQSRPYYLANKEKCHKTNSEWAKRNREAINDRVRKDYEKNPEKYLERIKEYNEKTGYKQKHEKEYREKNREKDRAQKKLRDHVKRGNIVRPTKCSVCNFEGKIEGHHADYTKPLQVIWVCRKCHMMFHRRKYNITA